MPSSTAGRGKSSYKFTNTVPNKSAMQAMLRNQDAVIDAIKAIAAKLDADAGVTDTNYASTITDLLSKIALVR
jgi:hypothetical protein